MASEFSDDTSELGGENEGVPMSSASSISNDNPPELPTVMSETEDSNSYSIEPSSSETDSYFGTGSRGKDDCSHRSSSSDVTLASGSKDGVGEGSGNKAFPLRPGITWRKGERLEAMDYLQKWYPAKITDIDEEQKYVLIHFEGWNQRYDEWVEMDSEYLRPLTRHSERRDKSRREKTVYKVGDQVLAKWTDCKMYLAKIDEVLSDGSYVVLFYDGFKKTIQPINLRPAPTEQKQHKFQIKPPVLSPKDLKKLRNKPVEYKVTDDSHATDKGKGKALKSKDTPPPSETQPVAKPHRTHVQPTSLKKRKLIISGSLFARREKSDKPEAPQTTKPKKHKDGSKVKEKQEVKVEAPSGTEDKVPGTEASCQTEVATATESPAKKTKRAGSFPPAVGKGRKPKIPKTVQGQGQGQGQGKTATAPAVVKKTKSADEGKPAESSVPAALPAPVLPVVPGIPPKAFVVEEDHNPFKCTVPGCSKGFRKSGLLASHVKYYHCDNSGQPSTPTVPRKRKKTLSTCSTDSDISVGSRSNSIKRRRHVSEMSLTGSPDVVMRMSFDEDSPGSAARTELGPVEENPVVEGEEESSEEVVNCICGYREENGLMIQCDACLCWQHTQCFNITDADLASNSSYICFVCKRPPGVRESCKHLYDLDWYRKGKLPTFSFLNMVPSEKRQREIQTSHDLVGEVLRVQKVLHGLREEIAVTGEREHPELRLWQTSAKEMRSVAVGTQDDNMDPSTTKPSSSVDGGSLQVQDKVDTGAGSEGELQQQQQQQQHEPDTESGVVKIETDTLTSSDSATGASDKNPNSALEVTSVDTAAGVDEVSANTGDATVRSNIASTDGGVTDDGSHEPPTDSGAAVDSSQSVAVDAGVAEVSSQSVDMDSSVAAVSSRTGARRSCDEPAVNGKIKLEGADVKVERGEESESQNSTQPQLQPQPQPQAATDRARDGQMSTDTVDPEGTTVKSEATEGVSQVEREADLEPKVEGNTEPVDATEEQAEDGGSAQVVQTDPFADCKLSVLKYVVQVQDELSAALDALEVQISELERQEFGDEAAGSFGNIPALKHSLYRIVRDLNKVKGIASYR